MFRKNKIVVPKKILNDGQLEILKMIVSMIKPIKFSIVKKLIIMCLITQISMDEIK